MTASDQLKDIFAEAMAQPASELPAFLDRVCNGDLDLRSQVMKLLASHRRASEFLHDPTRNVPDVPTEASEAVGTRIGPYKLLQLIGEGGFGSEHGVPPQASYDHGTPQGPEGDAERAPRST